MPASKQRTKSYRVLRARISQTAEWSMECCNSGCRVGDCLVLAKRQTNLSSCLKMQENVQAYPFGDDSLVASFERH